MYSITFISPGVVVTHPHPDHINGLPYILEHFGVEEVWTNGDETSVDGAGPLLERMRERGIPSRLVTSRSPAIDLGGVRFRILNPVTPAPPGADLGDREINERSLVLHLQWKDASFLLPADIGEPTESALVARRAIPSTGVLLAPHHGSAGSSSPPFLRAVRPSTVVISTGRNIREEVLERFRKTGAAVYRTDVNGAVRVMTDGMRYEVVPFKSP